MKKALLTFAAISALVSATAARAEDVKIGIVLGFTGPQESIMPGVAQAAETALKEVNDSGKFLDGKKLVPVRGDSTCVDAAAATATAERLVRSENVVALMTDCSPVSTAILNGVSIPNGVPQLSPSASSPALSTIDDHGLFFRTSASDARAGQVLADVIKSKGYGSVAITYTNNDYGKGYADALSAAFKELGGKVTVSVPHEDGKADYSAEVATLSAAGGDALIVLGLADQGGLGVIKASVEQGAFKVFGLGDGMYSDAVLKAVGKDMTGSFGIYPSAEGEGNDAFAKVAAAAGFEPEKAYRGQSYDAAALMVLAMAKGGKADRATIAANMLDVANAPGDKILPGELGKALDILKKGGDIDYVGATNVELIGPGEAAGSYLEYEVTDSKFKPVGTR
ncbi:branched-chain amino acid ABC transporter substrate-binding protein [Mesorhizobium loti]|nr:ABC transporter substrate-binding protein [Mesorhizobium loti]PLP56710.1 branched-chain amino acid ABC transporter substrate-binding protein [Mesorhizobium loti]